MGKDKSKKGKGALKTLKKTTQKLEKKAKKIERDAGEKPIEDILLEFRKEQERLTEVKIFDATAPSPRSHFTLNACPESSEIILFGGEYFDGKKITMFADLFVFDAKRNAWSIVSSPNTPPPRSGHQAVYVKNNSTPASVWIFGGEYASPSSSRFYHYKDLWRLHLRTRKWECLKVVGNTGPCARSGHRMLFYKNSIILFGGFNDTGRKTVYLNDLWRYDLSLNNWTQISLTGDVPTPRSACMFFLNSDQKSAIIFGGYHKELIGRDLEKGVICGDYFKIIFDKNNVATVTSVRFTGVRPKPLRSSMSGVPWSSNRVLVFGGLHDVESEDGETVTGYFHNDMYVVDLDKSKWHLFSYVQEKLHADLVDMNTSMETTEAPEADSSSTTVNPTTSSADSSALSGGIFTLKLGNPTTESFIPSPSPTQSKTLIPSPRSSAGLVILGSTLYLYGGTFESGDRKYTLDDFYSLDLTKPTSWRRIFEGTQSNQEWFGSDLDDDDENSDEDASANVERNAGKGDMEVDVDSSDDQDEEDGSDEELIEDAPLLNPDEAFDSYWTRTTDFWCCLMTKGLSESGESKPGTSSCCPDPAIIKLAERFARDFYDKSSVS